MSERESGEEPQRRKKTRGGKKTRRKHELFIEVAEGRHVPKARISDTPIGETGLDLERIRSLSDDPRDVVPKPKFTTSVVRVPPPSAKAKAASAIASASNPASSSDHWEPSLEEVLELPKAESIARLVYPPKAESVVVKSIASSKAGSAVSSVVPKPKGAKGESNLHLFPLRLPHQLLRR